MLLDVRFEQELELGAEARDALFEAGRFVDVREALHLRLKQLEGGADGEIEVAGGFEELFAVVEGLAAVGGHGQAGEEHAGALAELLGEGGQVVGALLCRAAARRCRGPALQSGCCETERPK